MERQFFCVRYKMCIFYLGGISALYDDSIFKTMRIFCINLSVSHAKNVPNQVTN